MGVWDGRENGSLCDRHDFLQTLLLSPLEVPGELEMSAARMKHFGWGREGEGLTAEEEAFVLARAEARFGTALKESASAPRLEDVERATDGSCDGWVR